MIRTSPTHYITPSSISITPNANGSANDLAVYIQDGTKIKVYSRRAGIDYVNGVAQEWTLTGRNRRLGDSGKPYTIYARLDKTDKDNAYLVFAPKVQVDGFWLDKYPYVSTDSATDTNDVAVPTEDVEYSLRNYYYVRLGDVSLPENGRREVSFDTGVLGTDQFNTEWALNPDSLPLRIELGCTIDDEDAGPTPYVYWDKSLVLTATLVEGWTGTDIQRFDHWEITRNTGIVGDDATWPSQARREAFASSGQIMLNHTKGSDDDFNAAVATTFIITAMGHSEDPESQALVTLATASIVILAETVEKYEMSFSTGIVSYNPQTESYTPTTGVAVRFRATDQRGDVFMLTRQQYDDAGLSVAYATVDSSSWTTVTPTGAAASEATVVIPVAAFASQQSVNVRLLNADGEELASGTIAFVRDGEDSREREWIFLRSATAITFGDILHPYPASIPYGEVNPTAAAGHVTNDKNQDGWVPEGWWDEMQGTDKDIQYEYAASRDWIHDDANGDHWGDFTVPKMWGHYGRDGKSAARLVLERTILTVKTDCNGVVLDDVDTFVRFGAIVDDTPLAISDETIDEDGETHYIVFADIVSSNSDDVSYDDRAVDTDEHGEQDGRSVVLDDVFVSQSVLRIHISKDTVLDEHIALISVVGVDAEGEEYRCGGTFEIVGIAEGVPGTDGYNTAVVTLYQRYAPTAQAPTPALPTGPMTYTFATGLLEAADASYFNGWSQTPPDATPGTKLYATQVSARSRQDTDEVLPNEWATPVEILLDGKDGKNAVRLDVDNEADMVQTDSAGHVLTASQIVTTVRLFDGEELQAISLAASDVSGINVGTGTNLLPAVSNAADGKGKVLTWSFTTAMTLQDHYDITISYTYNGKAHSTVFTLAASKGLAIFQLKPGMSAIPFAYSGGSYTPASRMLTLKVVKTDSGVDSEMEASAYGLSLIRYSFDAMPASKTAGTAWPGNSGVEVSRSGVSNVFIALFNSDGVRLDQESVPVVKDGVEGAPGVSSAMVIIYKRSATQPDNNDRPSGNTVYDFSTGTLTPAQGVDMKNWSLQIPAVDSSNPQPCWTRQATALSTTGTDTIGSSEWSGDQSGNAHKFTENGVAGTDGYNTAVVTLYQRYTPTEQTPTPALPTGTMIYSFSTGLLSAESSSYFNGWSQTPPNATANTRLFITQVSARSRYATDEILANEWASPIEITLDGKDGKNAVRLDIDNESDMVQTDSTGHVTAVRQIITTVRLFDGEELQAIYLTTANITGINVGTGTNLLPAVTTAPDGKGKVLTWSFNTSMTLQDHYDITISYTYNGKAHSVVFTLAASKGLAIFQLKPGMSAIPFAYSGGAYTPASRALTLKVVKTDSGVDSEMEASAYGLSLIRYSFDAMPASKTAGNAWPGNSGVTVSNSGVSNVFIALFNSDGVRLDQESVPVVKDGVEGAAGAKSAMVIIYKRSADQPGNTDRPSGNTVYDFSAGTLTPAQGVDMKNWSLQIPAVDSSNPLPCWTRQATALSATGTDTIGSSEWSGDSNGKAQKFVENGLAGSDAVNVIVNPASLIVNQSLQNTSNLDSLSEQILFSVMKGTTAKTVTKIDNIVVETDAAHNNRSKIAVSGSNSYYATLTAILKNADANGSYYDRAYFTCRVAYTDDGVTKYIEGVKVEVYANLLGDWKETVEADTKTEIGNSTWFNVDDNPASPTYGEIIESDRLGTFIRSSKENTSRLEDDAYFKITGWSNLQIQISAEDIAAYGNIYRLTFDMVSAEEDVTVTFAGTSINVKSYNTFEHEYTLSAGTYTLSFTKTSDGTALSPTVSNLALYAKTKTKYSQLKQTADGLTSDVVAIKNGKNLLSCVLTGEGWLSASISSTVSTAAVDVDDAWLVRKSGYNGIMSPTFTLPAGKYTLSFNANVATGTQCTISLRRSTNLRSSVFSADINPGADGRYVFSFELNASASLRFYAAAVKIRYPQIEVGSTATAFDAGDTEVSSKIKQEADNITLTVQRDYATKSELQLTADSITSTVRSGAGRNLFSFKGCAFGQASADCGYPAVQSYGMLLRFAGPSDASGRLARIAIPLLERGKTYTLSFEAKMKTATANIEIDLGDSNNGMRTIEVGTSWQNYEVTMPFNHLPDQNTDYKWLDFGIKSEDYNPNITNYALLRHVKLEEGEVATPFTIGKEDENNFFNPMVDTWSMNSLVEDSTIECPSGKKVYRTQDMPPSGSDYDYISIRNISNIQVGKVYTLTYWVKSSAKNIHRVTSHLWPNITSFDEDFKDIDSADGQTEKICTDGRTDVAVTTEWVKHYIHFYVMNAGGGGNCIAIRLTSADGYNNDSNSVLYISDPQLIEGYITESNNSSSEIKQTANDIKLFVTDGLEETGIYIEQGLIKAQTSKFEIWNQAGTTRTFSIDNDGNLQGAGSASITGTIRSGAYTENDTTKYANELGQNGSGHLAKGNIAWNSNGELSVTGSITATSGNITGTLSIGTNGLIVAGTGSKKIYIAQNQYSGSISLRDENGNSLILIDDLGETPEIVLRENPNTSTEKKLELNADVIRFSHDYNEYGDDTTIFMYTGAHNAHATYTDHYLRGGTEGEKSIMIGLLAKRGEEEGSDVTLKAQTYSGNSAWPQISDNDQFGNITAKGLVHAVPWGYVWSNYPSTRSKWAFLMVKVNN